MFIYGRSASNAIAIISYVAEVAPQRVGSGAVAKARNITPVLAAKLLTQLAAAGLLGGRPGPGGGYTLAKPAGAIRLIEVVELFEQIDDTSPCPFGSTWCGQGEPCPLHDEITAMVRNNRRYLEETRLSVFIRSDGPAPRSRPQPAPTAKPRRSPPAKRR